MNHTDEELDRCINATNDVPESSFSRVHMKPFLEELKALREKVRGDFQRKLQYEIRREALGGAPVGCSG